jgi:hypothetical protein
MMQIMWNPDRVGNHPDLLATTGDYLRLWEVQSSVGVEAGGHVQMRKLLNNNKNRLFPFHSAYARKVGFRNMMTIRLGIGHAEDQV